MLQLAMWAAWAATADAPAAKADAPPAAAARAEAPKAPARPAPKVSPEWRSKAEALIAAKPKSEAALMAEAILKGSQLGPGEGWFKAPAQRKHDWAWLAAAQGGDPKKGIAAKKFRGPAELFATLDRDGDGKLSADDFDWSEKSPYLRQLQMASMIFRQADADGDGDVTAAEWAAWHQRAGKGQPVSQEAVRRALFPKPPPGVDPAAEGPSADTLLRGLFAGEVGSMREGPNVGDAAPDIALADTKGVRIRLHDRIGAKPVALVFGNFSCGPFRSWGKTIAELAEKYSGKAEFLGVYVREAHPTDGWRMSSNDRAGIAYPQPTDVAGRAAVAARCCKALKMPFPLLVDTLEDAAGNAYSAMPARLYVLDRGGKVVFKSARGPFGFRPQEWEQALALALLEAEGK